MDGGSLVFLMVVCILENFVMERKKGMEAFF